MKTPLTARRAVSARVIDPQPFFRSIAASFLALIVMCLLATVARAEGEIIKSHGFAEFGELKYPAGFAHFDYVNPDAPKGGELSLSAVGTFDSMNPYTRKGRGGAMSADHFESLLVESYDEPGSYYGLLAESWSTRKRRIG